MLENYSIYSILYLIWYVHETVLDMYLKRELFAKERNSLMKESAVGMNDLWEKTDYTFEMSREVKDKMKNAGDLHRLISEDTLQDLHRVYVNKRIYCKVKRIMDTFLAAVGLVMLVIPMLLLAAVVYIDDPGPVIFSQYRVGRQGKRFKLYKFLTMQLETPKYLSTMEVNDPKKYITRVGGLLRKLSLDELPQLINVMKGDMSLVGPRPLISDEYEIHAMRMRFGVYSIRPGMTGLAQINGRDLVSPADKVRWDVRYLEDFGFWMDLRILLGTIPKIIGGEGVVEGYKNQDVINSKFYSNDPMGASGKGNK